MALFAFERFILDTDDRRLRADGATIELNARYFDALALLVGAEGQLVAKDRFLSDVWRGVPVTDEALTQCIKTLRRQLGDEAGRPRFIETVPKHGYRFIAPVRTLEGSVPATRSDPVRWRQFLTAGTAGTVGAACAGLIGGLVYGFASATGADGGALSTVLVMICLTLLVATIGGAGVSFAIATAVFATARTSLWTILAGAGGGLVVGAFGRLLGLDAFDLLLGRAPVGITGGMEGLFVGGSVGVAVALGDRSKSIRQAAAFAALAGAVGGCVLALLGGRLMLGSLAVVAQVFPRSRLHVEQFWHLFGETDFGPTAQFTSAALECGLFSGFVVTAMALARSRFGMRR